MKTTVPTSIEAISSAYTQDLTAAIIAATALAAVLLITYLVIRATFKIIRIFILTRLIADTLAVGLLATVVIIGLLNR
ncbi:hypothetical protein FB565_000773 [Actinoplanes lutulentus]|uniref:Uncharacterized protein n=1 Tax=Actinoplanes lutulentus TaxID=1287878 RepID=A0A327ZQW7_9ACTN|nr:hypothetical protein [Actinoplanes lutulentus]MBB2941069.1 hypothetical protein [Actinoplanes lutulentus]RAK43378.1 hypothetical protein B0I29_101508 [Actinoplanes lutulentus]